MSTVDQAPLLRIGEVARKAGVGVETVRFYERQGLIEEPARRASGYRQYDESAISRIRFIRRAKDLGFSLLEVGELLAMRTDPGPNCNAVKAQASEKIHQIEHKIESLRRMKAALEEVSARCGTQSDAEACPFLDALETL